MAATTKTRARPVELVEPPAPGELVEPAAPGRWRSSRRWEQALLAAGGVAAAWLMVGQLRRTDPLALLSAVRPGWAAVAVVLVSLSFVGAAWSLMGFSAVRLRLAPTVLVQVAGGFVKVISPAALGAAAVNARYLRCAGASRAQVVTSIGAAQSVQFAVTAVVLLGLSTTGGPSPASSWPESSTWWGSALAVAAVVLAAAAWFGRRHRRLRAVRDWVRQEAAAVVAHVVRQPGRSLLGVAGSLVLTLAFALGLASSVRAFGGGTDLLTVTAVFLAGSAAGSLVPTPGGLGTVEAALVAGLVATGLAVQVAVPAVLWFRLVSVWLPVPLGWVAVHRLRRRALL